MRVDWPEVRPSRQQVERYRALGVWRDSTPLDDLRRWALKTPDATAITAYRADSGIERLSYRAYYDHVERFVLVLDGLGVRSGDVVALQLPNWWQVNALVLAAARLGAIAAPITLELAPRELERVLHRLGDGEITPPPAGPAVRSRWRRLPRQPTRLEVVEALPRNAMAKVDKPLLRRRLHAA